MAKKPGCVDVVFLVTTKVDFHVRLQASLGPRRWGLGFMCSRVMFLFLKATDGFKLQIPHISGRICLSCFCKALQSASSSRSMFGDCGHQVIYRPTHRTSCSALSKAAPDSCCKVFVHEKLCRCSLSSDVVSPSCAISKF